MDKIDRLKSEIDVLTKMMEDFKEQIEESADSFSAIASISIAKHIAKNLPTDVSKLEKIKMGRRFLLTLHNASLNIFLELCEQESIAKELFKEG